MATLLALVCLSLLPTFAFAAPRPVILDVDPGIDDALAISIAVPMRPGEPGERDRRGSRSMSTPRGFSRFSSGDLKRPSSLG
jgi:hypothetical protein